MLPMFLANAMNIADIWSVFLWSMTSGSSSGESSSMSVARADWFWGGGVRAGWGLECNY